MYHAYSSVARVSVARVSVARVRMARVSVARVSVARATHSHVPLWALRFREHINIDHGVSPATASKNDHQPQPKQRLFKR